MFNKDIQIKTQKMASFNWENEVVPPNFILPEEIRPNLTKVSQSSSIPIIDMNENEDGLIQKVSRACEEFGFFQIINHGVSPELCRKMLDAIKEFFLLPPEEKAPLFSEDFTKQVRVFNRYLKFQGQDKKVSMWSEVLFHPWHPSEHFTHLLPMNPPQYRELMAEYAKEIGGLMTRLLSLISQGLGLEKNYLQRRLNDNPRYRAQANYYPPCPDPELTLGLAVHTDFNLITVLQQSDGVTGLQVIKDEKWVAVDPIPNSFVINLGDQMQVLSNGRYKSVHHRAVTNKDQARVSMAMFYGPDEDAVIGPIEDLVDEEHPAFYRSYLYKEFIEEFNRQEGTRRRVKEVFELHH